MRVRQKEIIELMVIVLPFIVISTFIFALFDIKNVYDSQRYLAYASNIENDLYYEEHDFWYIGYVLFIYIIRLLTNSYNELYLIIAQYLYSLVGFVFLYKTLKIFDKTSFSPIIGSVLYFMFIHICIWNSYILCESFYFNNIVMALYFLVVLTVQKRITTKNIIFAVSFIFLTALSKPTGIVVLLSLACSGYALFWVNSSKAKIIKVATLPIGFILFGFLLNKMLETFVIIENYQLGEIVFGVSILPQKAQYSNLIIPVPELNILSNNYPPILRLLHFILNNFDFWFSLFAKKTYYFLLHIRPYWSIKHNIYNMLVLIPVYFFAIKQFLHVAYSIKLFLIFFIGLHVLIVGMTTVDWDGRFFLPLLPVLIILSTQGISRLKFWNRIIRYNK